MKFLAIIFSVLVVIAFFSSAFAEDLEDEAESGEVNVVSKWKCENFPHSAIRMIWKFSFLTEREVDESYREHLVDMTRFFPGFDHNNELTDEGADMLNDIVEF